MTATQLLTLIKSNQDQNRSQQRSQTQQQQTQNEIAKLQADYDAKVAYLSKTYQLSDTDVTSMIFQEATAKYKNFQKLAKLPKLKASIECAISVNENLRKGARTKIQSEWYSIRKCNFGSRAKLYESTR